MKLKDVCIKGTSNIRQKDVNDSGRYPVYGAAGPVGFMNSFQYDEPYVGVVKDGAGIGRATYLPSNSSIIGTMQALIPKKNVLPKYLYYAVSSMHLEKYYSGATIPHIYFKNYKHERFVLVSKKEQEQIIWRFSLLEKMISNKQQQLLKLDELIKARFVEMFGDPRCNNFNWKKSSIKKSCTLKSGKSLSVSIENEGGDIPYIKVKDMNNPKNIPYITTSSKFVKIENVEKQIFPPGTVIFPKRGGAIGTNKKRLTEVTICADLNIMGVIPNAEKLNSQYLFAYFKTIDLKTLNNGSSVPQINNKDIEPLEISLPPLSLQNEYANFVRQVDKSKFENIVYLNKTLSSKILSQIGDVIRD
ncbi:restriction endonuclease subunit S [Limosilactobacillus reuteri]|uniref:restriction endonuclease subunit S n=1 Tax=Limosilactobacillus reuteri TaxID=1598 RepID=UPI00254B8A5E|nr:restriction endonuclease subunit S [Limosilactobacillus reuteri]